MCPVPPAADAARLGVEGGCLCAAVRYRAVGNASSPTLCNCRSCRKAAGSPLVAWVTFPVAGFDFVAGKPNSYRSSPDVVRTFCGACGTPLTWAHAKLPDLIDVTTCSLDDPEVHPPADQTWTSHRLGWMHRIDELPAFPRSRAAGS